MTIPIDAILYMFALLVERSMMRTSEKWASKLRHHVEVKIRRRVRMGSATLE
jgi:hypothetical protein